MKNNKYLSGTKYCLLIFIVLNLCSCNNALNGKLLWGECSTYDAFLYCKKSDFHLTRELKLNFNKHALNKCTPIILKVVELNEKGNNVDLSKGISVYQDSKLSPNNTISLSSNSKSTIIDFIVTRELSDGYHTFNLKVVNSGSLDRIDNTELDDSNIIDCGWCINKSSSINPLLLRIYIYCILACIFLFIWIFFIKKLCFPNMELKRVVVYYPNNEISTIKTIGTHKVYFSNKFHKKQSFFMRLLQGKRLYKKNMVWVNTKSVYLTKMTGRKTIALYATSDFSPSMFILSSRRPEVTLIKKKTKEEIKFKIKK